MNEGQEAVDYYFHYCPRIVINYSIDYVYILLVAFLFHAFDCYIDYFLLIMILNVFKYFIYYHIDYYINHDQIEYFVNNDELFGSICDYYIDWFIEYLLILY